MKFITTKTSSSYEREIEINSLDELLDYVKKEEQTSDRFDGVIITHDTGDRERPCKLETYDDYKD